MARGYGGQVSQWDKQKTFDSSNPLGYMPARANYFQAPGGFNPLNNSSTVSNANRINFFGYTVSRPININRIGIYCWTLQADSLLRIGIYNVDDNAVPTSLIADFGTVSGASTGTKTVTASVSVFGPFAVAYAASNHSTVRWGQILPVAGNSVFGDSAIANGQNACVLFVSGTDYSAGLPDPAPAVSVGTSSAHLPLIGGLVEFT
jgi:hypothetical protein